MWAETAGDLAWSFTDQAGHEHRPAGDQGSVSYPTLTWVPGPVIWCEADGDYHEDYNLSHWECRQCGEQIRPGVVHNVPFTVQTGPPEYTLNGDRVDQATAEAFIARLRAEADARQAAAVAGSLGYPAAFSEGPPA